MAGYLASAYTVAQTVAANTWQTIDVSGQVPADATGVIFRLRMSTGNPAMGVRAYGSTDAIKNATYYAGTPGSVGLSSDKKFQFQTNVAAGTVSIDIIGYYTSDATFFTNWTNKAGGTLNAWATIDLSDLIPTTAVAVMVCIEAAQGSVRNAGSSDARWNATAYGQPYRHATVGVTSQQIEFYTTSSSAKLYIVGYLTSGSFKTNGLDKSRSSANVYQAVDLSSDAPSDAVAAIVEHYHATGFQYNGYSRRDSSGYETAGGPNMIHYISQELTSSKTFEDKVNNTTLKTYVLGYLLSQSGGTTYTETLTDLITSQTTLLDRQDYLETAAILIESGVSITDVQTMLEAVLTVAATATTATDSQIYADAITDTVTGQAAATDQQTYFDTINETIVSSTSATDTPVEANTFSEALLITATAITQVGDAQTFVDAVTTVAQTAAALSELRLLLNNVEILCQSDISATEIQTYLHEVLATAQAQISLTEILVGAFVGRYLALEYATGRSFAESAPARSFAELAQPRSFMEYATPRGQV